MTSILIHTGFPARSLLDLSRLVNPRGIAIVGASDDPRRISGEPVRALAEYGYQGGVYPVNPKRTEIRGLRCYPDVTRVPQPCDVAIVVVAAHTVPKVIEQCGECRIPFAVVLSSGFREAGPAGQALEAELRTVIQRSGVRVVGPNCMGLLNLKDRVYNGFGSGFYPDLKVGPIALVTQSGGYGATMMMRAQEAGVGVTHFVSTGNAIDIGLLDMIAFFLERDEVEIVVTFIEGVSDGRRLREVGARALELGKPILICKAGNSEIGRMAAASHTATLTSGYPLYRAAFRTGGFIEIGDADDMIDVTRAFLGRRLPHGDRVVFVSASGGSGVMMADQCANHGLRLPPLSGQTLTRLRALLPDFVSAFNPLDLSGQRSPTGASISNQALKIVLDDPACDQVVLRSKQSTNKLEHARQVANIVERAGKPVLVALGADRDEDATRLFDERRISWHLTVVRAAVAAAALSEFAGKLRRYRSRAKAAARPLPVRPLQLPAGTNMLGEHDSKSCLAAYGIPVVHEILFGSLEELKACVALPIAFPCAVKIDSPDIPHKTEAGGVRLGIRDLRELQAAATQVHAAALKYKTDARLNGILVQEMADGVEVIVGAVDDPYFGPTVAFGLGGILTELLQDVTHRFAPFDVDTARDMISEIRSAPLLTGYRERPACDVDALADVLSRFSFLIADHADRIVEIDVNPLFVRRAGEGVVAADALVVLREQKNG